MMLPNVFLDQYRISKAADGTPVEMTRNGPAITYKASDLKSGAPVALTVVPTASVDPAQRDRFEQEARTAMQLDHANIAKTVAFGSTGDSLIFASEYPLGESVEAWVKVHGPMPPDAVLRVALQVVSALAAASFHGLNHPAIQPANIVIVTGKTAEGGWPLVKLTHFALSGLKSAPGHAEPDVSASDYASPEQLLQGKVDFRSEIYSLGAAMCFLLTGMFYSAYPRSPQTKRFRGPLRKLVSRMLEDDPAARPQDPVKFAEELRTCLVAVERRQRLQRQYGIPLAAIVKKPKRVPRFRRPRPVPLLAAVGRTAPATTSQSAEPVRRRIRWLRPGWAIAACLLLLGFIAALFLPEDVVTAAFRREKSPKIIGVPIGVPESLPPAVATSASAPSERVKTPSSEVVRENPATGSSSPARVAAASPSVGPVTAQKVAPQPAGAVARNLSDETAANSTPGPAQSPVTVARVESSGPPPVSAPVPSPTVEVINQTSAPSSEPTAAAVAANNVAPREPASSAEAPDSSTEAPVAENSAPARANASAPAPVSDEADESRLMAEKPSPVMAAREQKPRTKKPVVARSRVPSRQRVPRALPVEPGEVPPTQRGTFQARVVGVTPNGNVILALPNGERAIVSPQDADQYSRDGGTHRRPRRVIIERRIMMPPPSQFPPYQPFLPPGT